MKKAEQLDATVLDEYVDRGESARSANRPEVQRLLSDIKKKAIRYVIVHKIDRLARNREDDIAINLALKRAGVQLVSVMENVDEMPSGRLLYGLLAEMAQFYSHNLAMEVKKGLSQKAKAGGTPGLAPTGYKNVRSFEGGRESRTVELDPERAPLVQWAFEQYATGETTTVKLNDLRAKGLTTRPLGAKPAKPITLNGVSWMLRNPYYMGVVTYAGAQYQGKHEPLVSPELWLRVQDILASHDHVGEKTRRHPPYLKGSVFCGKCGGRLCSPEPRATEARMTTSSV